MADVPDQVSDNLETLEQVMANERERMGSHQRTIERVSNLIARPVTFYMLVAFGLLWVSYNTLAVHRGWWHWDHTPFGILQGLITFYAATATTAVLIAQRRQHEESERRSALEFHLNLLSEQKATKIIALLEELRRDLPNVKDRSDPIAEAMQQEVDPKAVHSALQPKH